MVKEVCVIGAGTCGLAILKYLTEYPEKFNVTVYEQTPQIGGTWVYTDRTGTDEDGIPIHTSMYKYLTTNIPKHLMELEGLSMPKELPSFIKRQDFMKYLQDYCEQFNLEKYIQFKTKVCNVTPLDNSEEQDTKWSVETKHFFDDDSKHKVFDYIVACNGHFCVPNIPDVPGLDSFQGKWIHSHDYRIPERFTGQNVMCVGGFHSGQEIATQLLGVTNKIYMSHGRNLPSFHNGVIQVPRLNEIRGNNRLILSDSSEVSDVDVLVFCTGFKYSYDFLDKSCRPNIDSRSKVTPLYQHIIHVEYPTLFFIGLPMFVPLAKTATVQSKFILSAMLGEMDLPSKEEMHKHIDEVLFTRESKYPNNRSYSRPMAILHSQWEYYAELADLGKFDNLPPVIEKMFKAVMKRLLNEFATFRYYEYEIIDDDNFTEKLSPKIKLPAMLNGNPEP